MDTAKLRLPAWTESDGQRLVLDPEQVPADMNEAADEIERLRAALKELAEAPYDCKTLAGGVAYMAAHSNAMRLLNQQSTHTVFRGCSGPGDSRELP